MQLQTFNSPTGRTTRSRKQRFGGNGDSPEYSVSSLKITNIISLNQLSSQNLNQAPSHPQDSCQRVENWLTRSEILGEASASFSDQTDQDQEGDPDVEEIVLEEPEDSELELNHVNVEGLSKEEDSVVEIVEDESGIEEVEILRMKETRASEDDTCQSPDETQEREGGEMPILEYFGSETTAEHYNCEKCGIIVTGGLRALVLNRSNHFTNSYEDMDRILETTIPSDESLECSSRSSKRDDDRKEPGGVVGPRNEKNKPFKCIFCPYRFSSKASCKVHERVHTGEKPFRCKFCSYRAARKNYITVHERMHTREKPYSCKQCDFKTSYSCSLRLHTQRVHHAAPER